MVMEYLEGPTLAELLARCHAANARLLLIRRAHRPAEPRRWAIADARPGAEGIGGVFVERDMPGFRIGRREFMMGLRGIPEGELHFEGCEVPREHLLVGPGDGFKKLMRAYNGQRLGAATVAKGWSGYFVSVFEIVGITLPTVAPIPQWTSGIAATHL